MTASVSRHLRNQISLLRPRDSVEHVEEKKRKVSVIAHLRGSWEKAKRRIKAYYSGYGSWIILFTISYRVFTNLMFSPRLRYREEFMPPEVNALTIYTKECGRNKYIERACPAQSSMDHIQPIRALLVIFNNRSGGIPEDFKVNWFSFARAWHDATCRRTFRFF